MPEHEPLMTRRALLLAFLSVITASLEGCADMHSVGAWEAQESYLDQYKLSIDTNVSSPLNTCAQTGMSSYLQCNGHGTCQAWDFSAPTTSVAPLMFCQCDEEWADPNCGTPRKSQIVAFVLSVFGGFLGLDQLYLGFFLPWGLFKLLTLGGMGLWWIFDIVRIGSSAVYTASDFKVARNLPHVAFVLTVLTVFPILAFVLSALSVKRHQNQKAREVLLLQADGARYFDGRKFTGYGSIVQNQKANAEAP
jgi:TM2 domain-containing membrane protein YozV